MVEKTRSSLNEILPTIKPILTIIDNLKEELIEDTIKITEIKAPPFKENERAELIEIMFKEIGYKTLIDSKGNVLAAIEFSSMKSPLIISAHLDTVFSENVEIRVKREGDRLFAPGVGDDSRGLVVLIHLAKLIKDLPLKIPVLFLATVGEEGIGDLRGVKFFFTDEEHNRFHPPRIFITIDGSETSRIVTKGIGSLRYRIHFRGPGGHSFGAFGYVNPAFALANCIQQIALIKVPTDPKTTYSVGLIGGGTSINSIPNHVWMDIDLRSEERIEIEKLYLKIRNIVTEVTISETKSRIGEITNSIEKIGDRPSGKLPEDSFLINAIKEANRFVNVKSNFVSSSTDANVPLSLGIPAISVAGIENSGRSHSLDEWIDAGESSLLPLKRNLVLIALLAM